MDNFEKYISDNANEFDSLNPQDNHFERFLHLVHQKEMSKTSKGRFYWLKIAAIALIMITISIFSYTRIYLNTENKFSLSDISAEYKEVETYYQTELNNKLKELEKLQCANGNVPKEEILIELKSIDELYNSLEHDLQNNAGNQKIINAMINCYQMKVEVLEQIIHQINANC